MMEQIQNNSAIFYAQTVAYLHKLPFCNNRHGCVEHCAWIRCVQFTHVYNMHVHVCTQKHTRALIVYMRVTHMTRVLG